MNFEQTAEFQKDLKRLSKKWRSLPNDIADAQKGLELLYVHRVGIDIKRLRDAFFGTNKATLLSQSDDLEVVKMRLDVADLGRSDKARIIFVAVKAENTITFIELYAKNEKPREDSKRINKYLT